MPEEQFTWFGEANVSRDPQDATKVTAVLATAVHNGYLQWHKKVKQLEKELVAAKAVSGAMDTGCASLREKLASAMEWKQRHDKLFELTDSIRGHSSQCTNYGLQNTVVHSIKPHEPARFDGSQNLEVVMQFLDDVEHYVRQGGSACPKATVDNQNIDTLWRFLSTKIFRWFEASMQQRGVPAIPPAEHDYGITWVSVKSAFKKQFVPEVAVSVVRKEWYALNFKAGVLGFNRRALS